MRGPICPEAVSPLFFSASSIVYRTLEPTCKLNSWPYRNQHIIKSSIPTSHAYVSPSNPKFKNVGTNFVGQNECRPCLSYSTKPFLTRAYIYRDRMCGPRTVPHRAQRFVTPSPTLKRALTPVIPIALAFRSWLGGEAAINAYCHQLALDGAQRLAELLGTRVMDPNGELTLSMVRSSPLLPSPSRLPRRTQKLTSRSRRATSSSPCPPRPPKAQSTRPRSSRRSTPSSASGSCSTGRRTRRCTSTPAPGGAAAVHRSTMRCVPHGGGSVEGKEGTLTRFFLVQISDFEYLAKALKAVCKEAEDTVLAAKD